MNGVGDLHEEYGDPRPPSLHTRLLDTGICSLIKPAAMVKLIPFPAKIHTVVL